jgi:hypothetical protein
MLEQRLGFDVRPAAALQGRDLVQEVTIAALTMVRLYQGKKIFFKMLFSLSSIFFGGGGVFQQCFIHIKRNDGIGFFVCEGVPTFFVFLRIIRPAGFRTQANVPSLVSTFAN